jgi:hypothetical protein
MTARFSVKKSYIEDDLSLVLKKQTPTVKVITVRLRVALTSRDGADARSPFALSSSVERNRTGTFKKKKKHVKGHNCTTGERGGGGGAGEGGGYAFTELLGLSRTFIGVLGPSPSNLLFCFLVGKKWQKGRGTNQRLSTPPSPAHDATMNLAAFLPYPTTCPHLHGIFRQFGT